MVLRCLAFSIKASLKAPKHLQGESLGGRCEVLRYQMQKVSPPTGQPQRAPQHLETPLGDAALGDESQKVDSVIFPADPFAEEKRRPSDRDDSKLRSRDARAQV